MLFFFTLFYISTDRLRLELGLAAYNVTLSGVLFCKMPAERLNGKLVGAVRPTTYWGLVRMAVGASV